MVGSRFCAAKPTICSRRVSKSGSAVTSSALTCSRTSDEKGELQLQVVAGLGYRDRQFEAPGGGLDLPQLTGGQYVTGVLEDTGGKAGARELAKQAEPLRLHLVRPQGISGCVPAWPAEALDEPGRDRIAAHSEDDWIDQMSPIFAARAEGSPPSSHRARLLFWPRGSAASVGRRSYSPRAHRNSIEMFCPSMEPASLQALTKCSDEIEPNPSGDLPLINPMRCSTS